MIYLHKHANCNVIYHDISSPPYMRTISGILLTINLHNLRNSRENF